MESPNPYQPPAAPLDPPEPVSAGGPLLPWEDPGGHPALAARIVATLGVLLRPAEAGPALGAGRRVGPAITFYAAVGLPLLWAAQVLAAVLKPGASPPWMGHFGLPPAPAVAPEALGLQRLLALGAALAAPVGLALSLLLQGAVLHLGLWATRGLRARKGMIVTYRTTLYANAAFALVSSVFALWPLLPLWPALILFAAMVLFWIAAAVYQGVLLARAHQTDTWRGVLGVFLPWLAFGCCCGAVALAAAAVLGAVGGAFR